MSDFEYYDPRRVHTDEEEEASEDRVTDTAPQPDLSPREGPPAPPVELAPREFRGPDLVYHEIAPLRTPMPEAWTSFAGGLLMTLSTWLTWTYASDEHVPLSALDLGDFGRLTLLCGAATILFGLVGAIRRVRNAARLGWLTGLVPLVYAASLTPKLYRGDYAVHLGSTVATTESLGIGLLVFALGAALTVFAALWSSSRHVGS